MRNLASWAGKLKATGRRFSRSLSLNGGFAVSHRPPPTCPLKVEEVVGRPSRLFSTTTTRLTSIPAAADTGTNTEACNKLKSTKGCPAGPWLVLPPQVFEQQEESPLAGGDYCRMGLLAVTGDYVPLSVPVPREGVREEVSTNWSWIGSSHGWLILGDPDANSLWLFNPFYYYSSNLHHHDSSSNSKHSFIIPLPDSTTIGIDSLPPKLPTRVFLSSPPLSHSLPQSTSAQYPPLDCEVVDRTCKVFVLYDKAIAFCTLKTDLTSSSPMKWKLLRLAPTSLALLRDAFFDGICLITLSSFSSNKDHETILQQWDFSDFPTSDPRVDRTNRCIIEEHMYRSQVALKYEKFCLPKAYLSVWSPHASGKFAGVLRSLIIMRYVAPRGIPDHGDEERPNGQRHKTVAFEVHSYHPGIGGLERVESLGNHALFLGDNQAFALPVGDDEDSPFRRNCIYFTDDYGGHSSLAAGHDCGIFCMADETIFPLHCFNDFANLHPHPIFLLPSDV